jgi:hypothetical protein
MNTNHTNTTVIQTTGEDTERERQRERVRAREIRVKGGMELQAKLFGEIENVSGASAFDETDLTEQRQVIFF